MPAKRKNTRKKANSGQSRASGKAGSKKQTNPSLKLVLERLDKIGERLETLEQNTAAEFKAVRGEIAQGRQETAGGFKAVRGEMAQGFDSLRQEFKAELQKEFEKHGAGIYQHISRVETELKAETAELRSEHRQLLTGMDAMVKNYENYTHDRAISDAKLHDLQRDVETLKKKDMEKAAAIDKIEKEVDKLKAA